MDQTNVVIDLPNAELVPASVAKRPLAEDALVDGGKRLKTQPAVETPSLDRAERPVYDMKKYIKPSAAFMAHQVENVNRFLDNIQASKTANSLLIADDPGLGKTLSAIGCMSALFSNNKDTKVLVVAPKCVTEQWRHEIEKFTRNINMDFVITNQLNKNALITIVSYEFVAYKFRSSFEAANFDGKKEWIRRPNVELPCLFEKDHFKAVVFDEAHKFRNSKTLCFHAMMNVAPSRAGCSEYPRIGLTGTPVINKPEDMTSISKVLKFGEPFESKFFFKSGILYDSKGFEKTLFIRHIKTDVLDLPKLNRGTKKLQMNSEEIAAQKKWISRMSIIAMKTQQKSATFVELLTALMRMRQSAIHPALPELTMEMAQLAAEKKNKDSDVESESSDSGDASALLDKEADSDDDSEDAPDSSSKQPKEKSKTAKQTSADDDSDLSGEEDEGYGDGSEDRMEKLIRDFALEWRRSSKFSWLVRKLKEQAEKGVDFGGILIYSSFSTPLRVLQYVLEAELGISVKLYIGSCSSDERAETVSSLLKGETRIVLLTYGSGGLGLNLCPAATTVIHLDAPWAPATMQQATDRAHRKGATEDISEVILMCSDTVDDYILNNIHVKKRTHMSKLDRLATTLRVRVSRDPDTAMNMKNVMSLVKWFERRRFKEPEEKKAAPQ
jgi:SNF2 family DNA or RNA helicase